MIRETYPVRENDDGIRPAGKPDECFYCHRKVGQIHNIETCQVVRKTALVRYSIEVEFEREIPWYETKEGFEAHLNEGSWCASNALQEIQDALDKAQDCLCNQKFKAELIKEIDSTPRSREKE